MVEYVAFILNKDLIDTLSIFKLKVSYTLLLKNPLVLMHKMNDFNLFKICMPQNSFQMLRLLISAADIPPLNEKFQESLLDAVFENVSAEFLTKINKRSGSIAGHCFWDGIVCSNRRLTKIDYEDCHYGNFNIAFLPHTANYIGIESCEQSYEVSTRCLPSESRCIYFRDNKIFGKFEMRTLPPNLIVLNVSLNAISGPIVLTHLPERLEAVYMWGNDLNKQTIYYANLPESVCYLQISSRRAASKPLVKRLPGAPKVDEKAIFESNSYTDRIKYRTKGYWQRVYWKA